MTNEIYDNLSNAKDKLVELQTAVEAVTCGLTVENRQVKLIDLMTEYGRFTVHLESIVGCVNDGLDELDRLNQEVKTLQNCIIEREG